MNKFAAQILGFPTEQILLNDLGRRVLYKRRAIQRDFQEDISIKRPEHASPKAHDVRNCNCAIISVLDKRIGKS